MSANYIVGKTAKYDQRSFFAHFQILNCLFSGFCDFLNIFKQFINKI